MTDVIEKDLEDLDRRAQAVLDWVPQSAKDKVSLRERTELEKWMLANPNESNVPFDNTELKD